MIKALKAKTTSHSIRHLKFLQALVDAVVDVENCACQPQATDDTDNNYDMTYPLDMSMG